MSSEVELVLGMNEQEWLSSTNPEVMLRWLALTATPGYANDSMSPRASDRKMRLFACACARQVWHLLTDDVPCPNAGRDGGTPYHDKYGCSVCSGTGRVNRSHRAVEVAERYADGEATEEELARAAREHASVPALAVFYPIPDPCLLATAAAWTVGGESEWLKERVCPFDQSIVQAALLRDLFGNPWRPVQRWKDEGMFALPQEHWDVLGPTVTVRSCSWVNKNVLALALAAYKERSEGTKCGRCEGSGGAGYGQFGLCPDCHGTGRIGEGFLDNDRLAVLADALEEAGCTEQAILDHLRSPGPHARGCWALDLVLGKE